MAKINLSDLTSGHGQIDTINANNALVETAINDQVAFRDIPTGETAPMIDDLDMNAKRLLNLPTPTTLAEPATKGYVDAIANLSTTTGVTTAVEAQTATAGQTVFTLTTLTYTPGSNNLDVYINGVHQDLSTYTETSTSQVTFSTALTTDDNVFFKVNQRSVSTDVVTSNNVTHTPAGTGAVTTDVQTMLRKIVWLTDYGADPTGVGDSTSALQNAYTHADSIEGELWIPAGDYKFTSALTWDGNVHVRGVGASTSIGGGATGVTLIPSGAFDAITITGGDGIFENFTVERATGDGAGIIIVNGTRINFRHIFIKDMTGAAGHGLWIKGAFRGHFDTVQSRNNGGDNFRLDGDAALATPAVNANVFTNCMSSSPGLSHLHFVQLSDANIFTNLGIEDNAQVSTTAALILEDTSVGGSCLNNIISCYIEDPLTRAAADANTDLTTPVIHLKSTSQNNFIHLTTMSFNNDSGSTITDLDLFDEGTDNTIWPMGASATWRMVGIQGPVQGTAGGTGKAMSITAGAGNSESGDTVGGALTVQGGAAGNGNANGGALKLDGGTPTGTGTRGELQLGGSGSDIKLLHRVFFSDTPQVLSDTGAWGTDPDITTLNTTLATTGASTCGLADATENGHLKILLMVTDGGDLVLTPTSLNGGTSLTFKAVGDYALLEWRNSAWNVVAATALLDSGVNLPVTGAGATRTLLASEHDKTFHFDRAAGIVYTLPAPGDAESFIGLKYRFITTTTITSNAAEVITDAGTTFMMGGITMIDTDDDSVQGFTGDGTSDVKISSNGTTTGGILGSEYTVELVSSTQWQVSGICIGSGVIATPFA